MKLTSALSGASQPTRNKETTPRGPLIPRCCQLTRAAVERAQQLQVPVVVSMVDAHGTETGDTADAGRPAGQQRTGAGAWTAVA